MATWTPEQIDALIQQSSQKYNLGIDWFRRQLGTESNLNPNAVNPRSHAAGIAQFMPATARGFGIDPMNPEQAIDAAARYNRQNLDRFNNDLPMALAAYNWGPGNVSKHGMSHLPAETQKYIGAITQGGAAQPMMDTIPTPPVPPAGGPPPALSQSVPGQGQPVPGQALPFGPALDVPPPPGSPGTSLADVLMGLGKRASNLT